MCCSVVDVDVGGVIEIRVFSDSGSDGSDLHRGRYTEKENTTKRMYAHGCVYPANIIDFDAPTTGRAFCFILCIFYDVE